MTALPSHQCGREAACHTALTVNVTWHNPNPNTIWNKLAARLGREPTNQEARDEVARILRDANGGDNA